MVRYLLATCLVLGAPAAPPVPSISEPTTPVEPPRPTIAEPLSPQTDTPEQNNVSGENERRSSAPRGTARLLPLWAEILGVIAGAGLIVTGNTLLALDGKCKGGGDPVTCPILIENTAHGAAFVTVGAGISVFFSVVLGVDHSLAAQSPGRAVLNQRALRF